VTVLDAPGGRGPLGGIVAALEASPVALCAVVAVDMPDCDPALLGALAARCAGIDAAVPLSERGPEPLHAVYARTALASLRRTLQSADVSMARVLAGLRVRYVRAAALGVPEGFAVNLNRPDDVRAWTEARRAAV
jgi:molybdopterin-guanine dinucleotide biosynthesis protein A